MNAVSALESRPYRCRVRMNRRGSTNHWIDTQWSSPEACEAACARACMEDPRIESYEIISGEPGSQTERTVPARHDAKRGQ